MNCQCQGLEEMFSDKVVNKDLSDYRAKGPDKTTRMLTEAIEAEGVEGLTLLDIGGGVGAVQHELLKAGAAQATSVDASSAYFTAAQAEAHRRGIADRVSFHQGNFTDLAAGIALADIVTLDRVICCYDDMEQLVKLSAGRARKIYGLVYPRDTWWLKIALVLSNLFYRVRRCSYRAFTHPTAAVDELVRSSGLKLRSYRRTLVWQVVIYTR